MAALRRETVMKRRYHPHPPGLIFLFVTVLLGFVAMNNQNNLLFWAFGIMLAALAISGSVSALMLLGVQAVRLHPRNGSVGQPLLVRYAVTNRNRVTPIFNVHIEDLPHAGTARWAEDMQPARAWIMHVGPRETVHGEAVFWPARRGEIVFDRLRVSTTFPFGLIRKSVTFSQAQRAYVLPRLHELKPGLLKRLTPAGPVGHRSTQRPGTGDDYYGMREHRPGDSMRHIAWKRVASTDQLIAIERAAPTPPRMRVALDLTTPTGALQARDRDPAALRELEERAISLAASIIRAADFAGLEIGLTILGAESSPLPIRRSHWHTARLMTALAAIDLDEPRQAPRLLPLLDRERAGIVVISPDRVRLALRRDDAVFLTAAQMENFIARPLDRSSATAVEAAGVARQPAGAAA